MSQTGVIPISTDCDLQVAVGSKIFGVSSSKFALLSPRFGALVPEGPRPALIRLNEDPEAICYILKSAHGFEPITFLSLDTVVKIADIMARYQIPESSPIHQGVKFYFIKETNLPANLEPKSVPKLVTIAKILGSSKRVQLLRDVFDCLQGEIDLSEPLQDNLLAIVYVKLLETREDIAATLLRFTQDVNVDQGVVDIFNTAVWVLSTHGSIKALKVRLEDIQSSQPSAVPCTQRCLDKISIATDKLSTYIEASTSSHAREEFLDAGNEAGCEEWDSDYTAVESGSVSIFEFSDVEENEFFDHFSENDYQSETGLTRSKTI